MLTSSDARLLRVFRIAVDPEDITAPEGTRKAAQSRERHLSSWQIAVAVVAIIIAGVSGFAVRWVAL